MLWINYHQILKDSIFYIDFLYKNCDEIFNGKDIALKEYYNLMSIIYNEYTTLSDDAEKLFNTFVDSNYTSATDKKRLFFYYSSLLN